MEEGARFYIQNAQTRLFLSRRNDINMVVEEEEEGGRLEGKERKGKSESSSSSNERRNTDEESMVLETGTMCWNESVEPSDAFTARHVDAPIQYTVGYCLSAATHLKKVSRLLNGSESGSEIENDSLSSPLIPDIVIDETIGVLRRLTSFCYGLSHPHGGEGEDMVEEEDEEEEGEEGDEEENEDENENENKTRAKARSILSELSMKSGSKDRQKCLHEMGVLRHVLSLLSNITTSTSKQNRNSSDDCILPDCYINLATVLYSLLQAIIVDLPTNQTRAASSLPLYLSHISQGVGAEQTITTLLGDNVELLEGESGRHALTVILMHVQARGASSSVLKFLAESCVTRNNSILEFNQRRICEELLPPRGGVESSSSSGSGGSGGSGSGSSSGSQTSSKISSLFLTLSLDKKGNKRPWLTRTPKRLLEECSGGGGESSSSQKKDAGNDRAVRKLTFDGIDDGIENDDDDDGAKQRKRRAAVLACELVENGLPEIIISLPGSSVDVFLSLASEKMLDLLESQLRLFSALCLGRNYTAISRLEEQYGYDLCVAVLHSPVSSPSSASTEGVRGAMALLLASLWVDRWPSTCWVLQHPVHTTDTLASACNSSNRSSNRDSSGDGGDDDDDDDDVIGDSDTLSNRFSLLRDIVWNHLSSTGGCMVYTRWDSNQCTAGKIREGEGGVF